MRLELLQKITYRKRHLIELQWTFHHKLRSIVLAVLSATRTTARALPWPLQECCRVNKYISWIGPNRRQIFVMMKKRIMRLLTMTATRTCHLSSQAYLHLQLRHHTEQDRSEHWIAVMTPVGLSVGRPWSTLEFLICLVSIPQGLGLPLHRSRPLLAAPK
jgi:hypothetical protein